MFLSPLNWHYAKFTSFEWKNADDDIQKRSSTPAPDPRSTRLTGPAPAVEPSESLAVKER